MKCYEKTGVLSTEDLSIPSENHLRKGVAVAECIQEIPCNPCVDSCPVNAISMKDINAPPVVDYDACIACGQCVGVCPGLAIFVVKKNDNEGLLTLPYEFLPIPEKGDRVNTIDRTGKKIGIGVVEKVKKQGKTMVVTVKINAADLMKVRHIQVRNKRE